MAKILIVDGDPKSAKAVARGLTEAGHTCTIRHKGKDALDVIGSEALDLLLIDAILPDVSGFSVCRNIRRSSELFHLPIVFFSEMSNPEEIRHGLAQGADDFIAKPINVAQLVQHVNHLIDASSRAKYTDVVTGLPDAEETRRRVQLWITRGAPFAVISCELLGVRRLAQDASADARDKALRHLGRALSLTGENFPPAEFFAGHMGGGFFLCLLPIDAGEVFAGKLLRSWRKHASGLAASLGVERPSPDGPSDFLDLLICTTARETREPCGAQDLLDTLSRIRRSVNEEVGGVHVDRRHAKSATGSASGPAGV